MSRRSRSSMRRSTSTTARLRAGFTLIEVMVVVVIIGLLVAVAAPSYMGTRGSAIESGLRQDAVHNLPGAQQYYMRAGGNYTGLTNATLPGGVVQSPGNTVLVTPVDPQTVEIRTFNAGASIRCTLRDGLNAQPIACTSGATSL